MNITLEQQIRERAFHLWEQGGRPHGQADYYWFAAEREMHAVAAQPEVKKRASVRRAEGPKAAPPRTTRARKTSSEVRA